MLGRKLTVYLIDGNDVGPKTIELGSWSGKAIYSPRSVLLPLMRERRNEFSKPGIYILKSDAQGDYLGDRIYIGEAESILARLKTHIDDSKIDFKECIVFISNNDILTKAHIKYLEARLFENARKASNCELTNSNKPTRSALPEADIAEMEYFIEQIKLILPIAGFNFLIPSIVTDKIDTSNKKRYYLTAQDLKAEMIETSEGYLVLKNSMAVIDDQPSLYKTYKIAKEKMKKDKILTRKGSYLVFNKNVLFSSVSAASATIRGRSSAGTIEWKDSNKKTFKDNQKHEYDN